MKIKNVSSGIVTISDLPGASAGQGLILQPGAEQLLFDEDAERSTQLASLITASVISKLSNEEPQDSGPAADADAAAAVTRANLCLLKSGAEPMTGPLAMGSFKITGLAAPTLAGDAARKTESDAALSAGTAAQSTANAALPKAGGTMTGAIAMGGFGVTDLAAPSGANDAARKTDSDAALSAGTAAQADATQALSDAAAAQADATQALSDAAAAQSTANAAQPAADLLFIDSAASAGGAASEVLVVTGLLATDDILAVSQRVGGANSTAALGWSTQANNALTVFWTGDPGAGAIVRVAIKR